MDIDKEMTHVQKFEKINELRNQNIKLLGHIEKHIIYLEDNNYDFNFYTELYKHISNDINMENLLKKL